MPETDDVKCFLNDISTKIKLLSSQKTTLKVKRNYAIAVFISKSDSATFYLTSLFLVMPRKRQFLIGALLTNLEVSKCQYSFKLQQVLRNIYISFLIHQTTQVKTISIVREFPKLIVV